MSAQRTIGSGERPSSSGVCPSRDAWTSVVDLSLLGRLAVVCGAYGLAAIAYLPRVGFDADEAEILLFSQRIAWGELPYRDYVYHYGSLCAYLNHAFGAAFGFSLPAFRMLTMALGLLIAIGLFLVAREIRDDWWAVLPSILYTGYGIRFQPLAPYATWYCLLFMCGACLALIRYRRSDRTAWLVLAGGLCGLAFATKHTLGAFYLAASALALRATDPSRGKGGSAWLPDVVAVLGAIIAFVVYTLLLKSLWANVLLFVPLMTLVAVIARRRLAAPGVPAPAPSRPVRAIRAWTEIGIVCVAFFVVQMVAVVPYTRDQGLVGAAGYYRALFNASIRFASLPLQSLDCGWPVSAGGLLAASIGAAWLVLLVFLGRTHAPSLAVFVAAPAFLALGGLAASGSVGNGVLHVIRAKLVAWWAQSCALLVPATCALTGLSVLSDRAKAQYEPSRGEDATIVLLAFSASHFFVILPIVLPAYYNIAAPPALVLATCLLGRIWSSMDRAIPTRAWKITAMIWLFALPGGFWIIAMQVARSGISHLGDCRLDSAAGSIEVDEPFLRRFESTRSAVDRIAPPDAAVFVFPVPSYNLLAGRRPWYSVMHLADGFLRPDEQRDLPAVLAAHRVDVIVSFDTRNPVTPDDIASLAPGLEPAFQLAHRDGNAAVWRRRNGAAAPR